MKHILPSVLITIGVVYAPLLSAQDLQQYYTRAIEAYKKGDADEFYKLIGSAREIHPYHQGILYQSGIASAMTGRKDEAIRYLKQAILIQNDFPLRIPELKVLDDQPGFKDLLKIQAEASIPIIHSDTAFLVRDRQLHLESLAPGASDDVFFCGSIHKRKVIKVTNGTAEDFTQTAQDGLCAVLGIKVDARKNVLWVSSSPLREMIDYNAALPSAVHAYDIKTGRLIRKYVPSDPGLQLVLGDLTISPRGEVFVSDSKNNLIFRVNETDGVLEQFYSSDAFWNIQGITFTDNGRYLYIADYVRGIFRLELDGMKLVQVSPEFELSLKGVDGLAYYENSLIAIQNNVNPMRVARYVLNRDGTKMVSYQILDRKHPAFNEPTGGHVVGNTFCYVANSQWSGYQDDRIKPADQLQDIVILKVNLR